MAFPTYNQLGPQEATQVFVAVALFWYDMGILHMAHMVLFVLLFLRASYSQIQPFAIVLGFRREAIAHRLHLVGVIIHISSHNSEKTRSPPVRRPSSPSLLRSKYLARSVRIPRGDISGHPATKGGVRVRGEGGGLESQNKSGKKLDLSHRGGGLELLSLWPVGRARMDLDR